MKTDEKVVKKSETGTLLLVVGGSVITIALMLFIGKLSDAIGILISDRVEESVGLVATPSPNEITLLHAKGAILCSLKPLPESYNAEKLVILFDERPAAMYYCAVNE